MSEARPASVLAELRRGPILEGVVRGHVVVVDAPGNLVAWSGLPETRTALRSALKPLQAASLVESGAADALGLDERSLAVACASHQGEPGHLVEVRRLLELGGVAADSLRCGAHPPADPQASRQLVLAGESPTALHNNCSGKHAGLLVASRQRGWPLAGYLERHHPIQEEIAARLGRHCGHPAEQLVYGTDGCGLPTYELTLLEFASALLSATREDQAVRRCQAAMSAHPWLVGGSTSFDTAVMELVGERLSCKGGAAGLFGAVSRDGSLAVAIKLESGTPTGLPQVAAHTLRLLGLLPDAGPSHLDELASPQVHNWAGTLVGEIRCDFELQS